MIPRLMHSRISPLPREVTFCSSANVNSFFEVICRCQTKSTVSYFDLSGQDPSSKPAYPRLQPHIQTPPRAQCPGIVSDARNKRSVEGVGDGIACLVQS